MIVCDSSLFISDAVTKALVVHSRARERAREASIGTYDACVSIDHFFFRLSRRSFALSTVVEAGVRRREKLFPLGSRRGERERERERRGLMSASVMWSGRSPVKGKTGWCDSAGWRRGGV